MAEFIMKKAPAEDAGRRPSRTLSAFLLVLTAIAASYGAWLLVFWPGILGEDSLAVLYEIESNGSFQSGKPTLWYYFVKLLYSPGRLVEIPIAVQMSIAALVFSRILTWCWLHGFKKIFLFGLIFICLAPNMIYFVGMLYSDGVFASCTVGLLFEFWFIAKHRRASLASLAVVAITFPFAVFARPNGAVFLAALLALLFVVPRWDRVKLLVVAIVWVVLVFIGAKAHPTAKHGVLFPLALFETVNFLQPRPMNLWMESPRVSQKSIDLLTKQHPLPKIVENYDPDYWDPLVYKVDGANLLSMQRPDQRKLVLEFFSYNIWHNIPDFLASRVNIFMVAVLAEGGMPSFEYASHIIKKTRSQSEFRWFNMSRTAVFLEKMHKLSFSLRWILWSPLLGIFLMFSLLLSGWKRRDFPTLLVTVPMVAQLGGIFLFSIAGEYRYLLPYFVLPLVLLPILAMQRRQTEAV